MHETELAQVYEARIPLLTVLKDAIEDRARQALQAVPHIDRISFRVKGPASFLKKAKEPRYSDPLSELEDQVAGRIITFFRDDISVVKTKLTEWFGDVEHETKEPSGPSEFGYESDHFVFVIPEHLKSDNWEDHERMPTTFELQVRTLFIHAWAEPQHDLGYKSDVAPARELVRRLAWIAASAWGADQTLNEVARQLSQDPDPKSLDLPR